MFRTFPYISKSPLVIRKFAIAVRWWPAASRYSREIINKAESKLGIKRNQESILVLAPSPRHLCSDMKAWPRRLSDCADCGSQRFWKSSSHDGASFEDNCLMCKVEPSFSHRPTYTRRHSHSHRTYRGSFVDPTRSLWGSRMETLIALSISSRLRMRYMLFVFHNDSSYKILYYRCFCPCTRVSVIFFIDHFSGENCHWLSHWKKEGRGSSLKPVSPFMSTMSRKDADECE